MRLATAWGIRSRGTLPPCQNQRKLGNDMSMYHHAVHSMCSGIISYQFIKATF